METETHHFSVGSFQCIAVSDGTHRYEPPTFPPPSIFLFSNAPKDELERILRKYNIQPESWDKWISPYICFMVDTGKHKVLVETGADGLGPNTGKLVQNLKAVGVEREDIDTVVLTHGHPDHIGGNVDDDGNLTFPNAHYVMCKREWDFWTSGEAAQVYNKHVSEVLLAFAQKNLPPIEERLDLVDHETEIIPGITTIEAPGHTPGQLAIMVESEDDRLLYFSDAVLHPIQVERPNWHSVIDLDIKQSEATRQKLIARAVSDEILVLAFHFPFPGLGRFEQKEHWEWQPIEM